jgi:hypothetical protein
MSVKIWDVYCRLLTILQSIIFLSKCLLVSSFVTPLIKLCLFHGMTYRLVKTFARKYYDVQNMVRKLLSLWTLPAWRLPFYIQYAIVQCSNVLVVLCVDIAEHCYNWLFNKEVVFVQDRFMWLCVHVWIKSLSKAMSKQPWTTKRETGRNNNLTINISC